MEELRDSDIKNLDKAFKSLDLETHNVKMDIVESSAQGHRRRFGEEYRRRHGIFDGSKASSMYSTVVNQERNTPMERFRPEGINPFGIYLDWY